MVGLTGSGRVEAGHHLRVYRPWGYYESLEETDHFQVKHIMVKPGGLLSLQRHRKRSEHWVVIGGTATVTRGEDIFTLKENGTTFIPVGMIHRLANEGKAPLHLIEVQTGSYFGEDDIERLDDIYGRQDGR